MLKYHAHRLYVILSDLFRGLRSFFSQGQRLGWLAWIQKTPWYLPVTGATAVAIAAFGFFTDINTIFNPAATPTEIAKAVKDALKPGQATPAPPSPAEIAARRAAERAKGNRIAIVIAKLPGDTADGSNRALVIEALTSQLGDGVEIIKSAEAVAIHDEIAKQDAALNDANAQAQAVLARTKADLLIWGTVLKPGESVKLKFAAREADLGDGAARMQAFRADAEGMELDLRFKEAFAATLAAVAANYAAPAFAKTGHFMADILEPQVKKLQLLTATGMPGAGPDAKGRVWKALGDAEQVLGEQRGTSDWLNLAVAAYGEALKEWTRERVPLDWAVTQNNLGNALQTLGERESGAARLEEAVKAYNEALKEYTRERAPLDWAMTQNNLGVALQSLGERESGTAMLEDAVKAYNEALKEWTRKRVPLAWAGTQNNLGIALRTLGARESGTARLEDAVKAYTEALKERTRTRVPLAWAMTQNNLGAALRVLGAREIGTAKGLKYLEDAVKAYNEALKEYTRERVPLDWAMTQNNLGSALGSLGARESGTARLEEAVMAFNEALKEYTRERVPLAWAQIQGNLAILFKIWFEKTKDKAKLTEALASVDLALEVYREGKAVFYIENAERLRARIVAAMDKLK